MSEFNILNQYIWRQLTSAEARLPHALLFAGPPGVGKRELAEALAVRLLCERPRQAFEPACGVCESCLMWAGGQHPDFRLLQPEAAEAEEEGSGQPGGAEGEKKKASKQIRIQQVREVEEFFFVGAHRGGARVCLIDPTEAMNAVTANALLKILEEPSSSFYFLMVSHHWRRLLPTILSRTRRIMFGRPDTEAARRWLAGRNLAARTKWLPFFGQAPLSVAAAEDSGKLKALDALVADLMKPQDPLAQAGRWEALVKADAALGMEDLVTALQKWLFDLAQCVVGSPPRYLPGEAEPLKALARRASLPALIEAQRQLGKLRALANHPLNPRLFLEDLCVRAFRPFSL